MHDPAALYEVETKVMLRQMHTSNAELSRKLVALKELLTSDA